MAPAAAAGTAGTAAQTVQWAGLVTSVVSGSCGLFMAVALALSLWKTRRRRGGGGGGAFHDGQVMRLCHKLLVVTSGADFVYCVAVLLHQPFLGAAAYGSPTLCTLQGALIDVTLLVSACAFCALAIEVHVIHRSLLHRPTSPLPTSSRTRPPGMSRSPEANWRRRRRRTAIYAACIVLVPGMVVLWNAATGHYGASDRAAVTETAWCWLEDPEPFRNAFLGFFFWIWSSGLCSLILNVGTACRLRSATVMQITAADQPLVRSAKKRARKKALGMTAYSFIFIACWIPGSVRHFVPEVDRTLWLECLHFSCVGSIGLLQLMCWIVLNSTVRRVFYEFFGDCLHCRCGERRRSTSGLGDLSAMSPSWRHARRPDPGRRSSGGDSWRAQAHQWYGSLDGAGSSLFGSNGVPDRFGSLFGSNGVPDRFGSYGAAEQTQPQEEEGDVAYLPPRANNGDDDAPVDPPQNTTQHSTSEKVT